jgi:hypothetical protein
MSKGIQKIIVKNDAEPITSWNSLCKDPTTFISELASRLALSYDIISDSIVISEKVPEPSDRSKLWVKTSWPYGVGKLIEGKFQMDYGMSGMLPNIPFQASATLFEPARDFVRKLSDVEVRDFGLYSADVTKATKKLSWYIFEPNEISY